MSRSLLTARLSGQDWAQSIRRPSVVFLILVNLIPLLGVFILQWDIGALMLIYWIETVVIGLFNLPKLFTCGVGKRQFGSMNFANVFLLGFFTVHYGIFNIVHLVFLSQMFELPSMDRGLLLAVAGLAVSHLFSLVVNWFGKGEYKEASAGEQMFKPYGRVVIMHITIILGGVFAMQGQGVFPLLLLIGLKTLSDIAAHIISHKWMRKTPVTT